MTFPPDLTDPHQAARFFCFMGYSHNRVVNFLVERLGVTPREATLISIEAADHVRKSDAYMDSEVAKNEAAMNAEHDLSKSNDPRGGSDG